MSYDPSTNALAAFALFKSLGATDDEALAALELLDTVPIPDDLRTAIKQAREALATVKSARRSLNAQIAAHQSWAQCPDRTKRTAKARAARDAKFLEDAGGDPERAASLRKEHFKQLGIKSAEARAEARKRATT